MQHLLKVRDQSIQNQQQEIAVGTLTQNNDQPHCAILLPILLHYQQSLSVLEHALPSVHKVLLLRNIYLSAIIPAQNFKEEAKKQRQIIQALERERDRYGKDAAEAQQSCISQVCVVNVDGLVGQ